MTDRKLATIRMIDEIISINGADRICQYRLGGWKVVDQVGKYNVGDLVVYCEIDSWIPNSIAPFLSKDKEPKEYMCVKGERLRTIRLKKALSQGLLLPLWTNSAIEDANIENVGHDVTEILGIIKWEPPAEFTSADAKGNFPIKIPKTNQERIQNLQDEFVEWSKGEYDWVMEEKLDGSSMTVYYINGEFGVCSRNLDLIRSDTNTFWKVAIKNKLEETLKKYCEFNNCNIAIQGELLGPGVQGNRYFLQDHELFVFDVFDVDQQKYYNWLDRNEFVDEFGLKSVPTLKTTTLNGDTIENLLKAADGISAISPKTVREGFVLKCEVNPDISFKVISNKFLDRFEDIIHV